MIKHQTEFLYQNLTGILDTVYHYVSFTDYGIVALRQFVKNLKFYLTDNFINLNAQLLEALLKRDDLYVDEIEIWESLMKWFCSTKYDE